MRKSSVIIALSFIIVLVIWSLSASLLQASSISLPVLISIIAIHGLVVIGIIFAIIVYSRGGFGSIRAWADRKLSRITTPTFTIRITEEPLTALDLTTILSAITQLHTKYWLIEKGRFDDLTKYTDSRDPRFDKEAHLVITKLKYSSPFEITFSLGLDKLVTAFVQAISDIVQLRQKIKKGKLEIQREEIALKNERLKLAEKEIDFIDIYLPNTNKAALIQSLLPEFSQLINHKGGELELIKCKGVELPQPVRQSAGSKRVVPRAAPSHKRHIVHSQPVGSKQAPWSPKQPPIVPVPPMQELNWPIPQPDLENELEWSPKQPSIVPVWQPDLENEPKKQMLNIQ